MRIAVFGAAGEVGRRVVAEARSRGHEVTPVVRTARPGAEVADAANADDVARLSAGHDLVITATRPAPGSEHELAIVAKAVLEGARRAGVRVLVVGGAGSLNVAGGGTVLDQVPAEIRPIAEACGEQLAVCLAEMSVDWAYLSPASLLEPGERTGTYRLGGDDLIVDDNGVSRISMEDLAVALIDEAETPKHHRVRFTVAR